MFREFQLNCFISKMSLKFSAQTWQRFHDRIRAMIVVVISITLTTYLLGMRDRTDRKIVQDRAKLAA